MYGDGPGSTQVSYEKDGKRVSNCWTISLQGILREEVNSYQATSVGKGAVATNKNVTSNGLPKNFYSKNICNHLLSFLVENNTKYMSNLGGFLTYKN